MTIKEAAKHLSVRMSHRIGRATVMDLVHAGEIGFKDMTRPGAKRRRFVIQPEHIEAYITKAGTLRAVKPKKSPRWSIPHPRVHC